jgi:hypothetical protein
MAIQKKEVEEKLQRQREVLRQNGQELIEAQSKVADCEERLIQTESLLVNAKASWANSEHEKEIMRNNMRELESLINDKIEGGLDALYGH